MLARLVRSIVVSFAVLALVLVVPCFSAISVRGAYSLVDADDADFEDFDFDVPVLSADGVGDSADGADGTEADDSDSHSDSHSADSRDRAPNMKNKPSNKSDNRVVDVSTSFLKQRESILPIVKNESDEEVRSTKYKQWCNHFNFNFNFNFNYT